MKTPRWVKRRSRERSTSPAAVAIAAATPARFPSRSIRARSPAGRSGSDAAARSSSPAESGTVVVSPFAPFQALPAAAKKASKHA